MQVFVISLKGSQSESNRKLASMLENERFTVSVIDAVYGPELNAKEYFSAIQHYLSFRNRLITPSELGCALSHKKAYEALLRTGESHALILEDDVILDADACVSIRQIMEKMGQFDGYLHLGGMDGLLRSFERVGGTICCEIPPVFRVHDGDLGHLYRTVGYVISASFAKEVLSLMERDIFVIDDFSHVRNHVQVGDFYFSSVVKHPTDLSASSIQSERTTMATRPKPPGLARQIWREIDLTLRAKRKIANQLRAIDAGSLPNE
ncbi:glycosyltransferase family 25 protein [Paraburkholderia tropica]|uniref:glycosyltransferase family 25 protein n=1 Tax=Paraburkholderia tropica TaxID=92647 RepID=UPI002AB6E8FD|nr:glycosyltransferase family 25 protein [Paraburkholderia tropica]